MNRHADFGLPALANDDYDLRPPRLYGPQYDQPPMRRGSNQVLDRVDLRDRVIGLVARQDVFHEGAGFRVAHLLLRNRRSQVLLQRLADGRKRHPGRWGSSVAAYVASGEDYADAVRRRTRQELGVEVGDLTHLGTILMEEEGGSSKFVAVFSAQWDGEIQIDRSHVSDVRFSAVRDIQRDLEAEPNRFTPTFLRLADHYLAQAG